MIVKYAQEHDPELVKQAQAIATKHATLWEPFARIHLIMKYASVMSVERQVELHTKSAEFIKQYFELLEETNKCPKRHFIEYLLADWADRFSSVGLFAEDATESIHAMINRMLKRLQAVKGKKKYECMLKPCLRSKIQIWEPRMTS